MPLVKLHRRAGHPPEINRAIVDAIHDALVAAFRIPEHDRNHLILEHDADHFDIPPDRTPAFALIEIRAFPGRSREAKATLYREIALRLEALGIAPGDVFVILDEPALDNWSVRNGLSAAETRPAFKLDV